MEKQAMNYINLTPHPIVLNDGETFMSKGIARCAQTFEPITGRVGVLKSTFGPVEGLPAPQEGVSYIVSALVLSAAQAQGRTDCVAPATGHKDTIRNEKGHIVSVPCFII